ncbi:hypothetical protein ACFL2R_03880 [Patescibacteria group bacterium]
MIGLICAGLAAVVAGSVYGLLNTCKKGKDAGSESSEDRVRCFRDSYGADYFKDPGKRHLINSKVKSGALFKYVTLLDSKGGDSESNISESFARSFRVNPGKLKKGEKAYIQLIRAIEKNQDGTDDIVEYWEVNN